MELNFMERMTLLKILPKEGNFATLKIIRDLQNTLAPSEEEFKYLEIVQDGELTKWNAAKGQETKNLDLGAKQTAIIIETLEKLDTNKNITFAEYSLCEKFLGE